MIANDLSQDQRVELFAALGTRIHNISESELAELVGRASNENGWFTHENVERAFQGIAKLLDAGSLRRLSQRYDFESGSPETIGVVMAGNIPMVGFHDLLCVLLSGNRLAAKLSSSDTVLMKWMASEICELEPALKTSISFPDRLNDVDAIIATGSDNSARYFEYYFSKKPHIIRKNRTSCAILNGTETEEDIKLLGHDMLDYFGLGCRNISKVFVPRDFDFVKLLDGLEAQKVVSNHHKYQNNYDYNKSIYLVNGVAHLDNGFALFRESEELVSPISVIYYQFYNSETHLKSLLSSMSEKIQCIAGKHQLATVEFGSTQSPEVDDFADGIDTLKFLETLSTQ